MTSKLNDFRLNYETAFLFVLSNEYDIPFPKLFGMYKISDKIFWAYLALFSNMSRMGVRKGSQVSKSANRIYKSIFGIKDKSTRKVEFDVIDEDGNNVLDEKGKKKTEKRTVTEHHPIILKDIEERLKTIMKYFNTRGYSNGSKFYSNDTVFDLKTSLALKNDIVNIGGEVFSKCSQIEYILEKFFPEMTIKEFRDLSIKRLNLLLEENNLYSIIEEEEKQDLEVSH